MGANVVVGVSVVAGCGWCCFGYIHLVFGTNIIVLCGPQNRPWFHIISGRRQKLWEAVN